MKTQQTDSRSRTFKVVTARPIRRAVLTALLIVPAFQACRSMTDGTSPPVPKLPASIRLMIEPGETTDTTITVGVRLAGIDSLTIGSMTADISYDTTRLRFVSDVSVPDGAMRATSASRGRVSFAVAHTTGLRSDIAARLQFATRDTAAYKSLALSVREMHRIDATDARSSLMIVPGATRVRRGTP